MRNVLPNVMRTPPRLVRRALCVVLPSALLAAATLTLAPPRRAQAQAPRPNLSQEAWKRLVTTAVRRQKGKPFSPQAAARKYQYRLDASNVVVTDMDASGTLTFGDIVAAEGVLTDRFGTAGVFESVETLTTEGSVGTIQLGFPEIGTVVVGGGTAYSDGIRSQIPARAVLGGTGRYAKLTGNAGYVSDGTDLFVILNVR